MDQTSLQDVGQRTSCRRLVAVVALMIAAAGALLPLDPLVSRMATGIRMGGDIKRTLESLQQFGDVGTLVIASIIIFLLDTRRRVRLLDMVVAAVLVAMACNVLKLGLGRPRPVLGDPYGFVLPWQTHEMDVKDGTGKTTRMAVHAWDIVRAHSAVLWSMPSSHTSAAAALGVFLTKTYPRLKPLMIGIVVLVACVRVLFGAHYPSDTVVGAGLGYVLATLAVEGKWGSGWCKMTKDQIPMTK